MKPVSARLGIVPQVWQTRSCDMSSVDPDRLAFVLQLCNFNSSHNTNAICLQRSPSTKEQTEVILLLMVISPKQGEIPAQEEC